MSRFISLFLFVFLLSSTAFAELKETQQSFSVGVTSPRIEKNTKLHASYTYFHIPDADVTKTFTYVGADIGGGVIGVYTGFVTDQFAPSTTSPLLSLWLSGNKSNVYFFGEIDRYWRGNFLGNNEDYFWLGEISVKREGVKLAAYIEGVDHVSSAGPRLCISQGPFTLKITYLFGLRSE